MYCLAQHTPTRCVPRASARTADHHHLQCTPQNLHWTTKKSTKVSRNHCRPLWTATSHQVSQAVTMDFEWILRRTHNQSWPPHYGSQQTCRPPRTIMKLLGPSRAESRVHHMKTMQMWGHKDERNMIYNSLLDSHKGCPWPREDNDWLSDYMFTMLIPRLLIRCITVFLNSNNSTENVRELLGLLSTV